MKWIPLFLVAFLPFLLSAQPDTLWIPEHGDVVPFAISYGPVSTEAQSVRIGRFVADTSHIAVRMDYKRGFPSGVYRAFYPDGSPLIFAVYGWKVPHGDWTEYGEDGSVTLKGKYRHGLRDGMWHFRKEGIIGYYKDGLKHGKWKYMDNGVPMRTDKYRKDELKRTRNFNAN